MNLVTSTREGTLLKDVSSGGVTKSWLPQSNKCKSSPPTTLPQLQLFRHDRPTGKPSGTIPRKVYHSISFFGNRWLACKDGHFHRRRHQLVGFSKAMVWATGRILDRVRLELLTLEDLSSYWGNFPYWDWDSEYHPYRPKRILEDAVVIVLTGLALPAFAYYRCEKPWRNYAWKKQDSTIIDPNGSRADRFMTLCSGVWLRGKVYALSMQGTLVVIEQDCSATSSNGGYRVGSLGKQRMVPCVPCKHFREILVESEGEILLLFLIFRKSVESVDGLEVHRLDTEKLEWARLHDLGGRVLFFGTNCCVSVSVAQAEKLGCRRNCVYFKHNCSAGWSEYDMAKGTINRTAGLQD